MKPGTWATGIVISAIAISTCLAAQGQASEEQNAKHHRYKLVEIGTFGCPNSYFTFITQTLNRQGAAIGFADTSTGLNPPFCLVDCFATHAFEWRDGRVYRRGPNHSFHG